MSENDQAIYPCDDCGKMRTKDQGGTVFTVCDTCWEKKYPKATTDTQQRQPYLPCPKSEDGRHEWFYPDYDAQQSGIMTCRKCDNRCVGYEADDYCNDAAARIAELEKEKRDMAIGCVKAIMIGSVLQDTEFRDQLLELHPELIERTR